MSWPFSPQKAQRLADDLAAVLRRHNVRMVDLGTHMTIKPIRLAWGYERPTIVVRGDEDDITREGDGR